MRQKAYQIHTDDLRGVISRLCAGDRVFLSGTIYTARDAAHKKIVALLDKGEPLPFPIGDSVVYYASPTPPPAGRTDIAVGACGPTTSSRMDGFAPRLLDLGMAAMIGKGERSDEVTDAIVRNGCVYFCAIGGAGALMSKHIQSAEEIAFHELGCESIKRMHVSGMPLIVAIDCRGVNLFRAGRARYAR